jgi:DNA-binding CsgD family transcriptional regulator
LNEVRDFLAVATIDPSEQGCVLLAGLLRPERVPPYKRQVWVRIGAHLAAAQRLRRCLRRGLAEEPEAIFNAAGKLEHAAGPATGEAARFALRRAVEALERSRGPMRWSDPNAALAMRQGLTDARWTVLDEFDRDGKRYFVARVNDPEIAWFQKLSPRERQVASYAALGHSNKLIAYELGLATATVGVLVSRAVAKLHLRSRKELCRILKTIVARESR